MPELLPELLPAAEPHAPARDTATPRPDFYTDAHRALRQRMVCALTQLGRADLDDGEERDHACMQLEALLDELRAHVHLEGDHLHTAIEARRPAGAAISARDHDVQLDAIADLAEDLQALRRAAGARRPLLAQPLYRQLALFVAAQLRHMEHEESVDAAALRALYDDDELAAIACRLLAATAPPAT